MVGGEFYGHNQQNGDKELSLGSGVFYHVRVASQHRILASAATILLMSGVAVVGVSAQSHNFNSEQAQILQLQATMKMTQARIQVLITKANQLAQEIPVEKKLIANEAQQLGAVISYEYRVANNNVLLVLGSSSFTQALDNQIALGDISSTAAGQLEVLHHELMIEQQHAAELRAAKKQAKALLAKISNEYVGLQATVLQQQIAAQKAVLAANAAKLPSRTPVITTPRRVTPTKGKSKAKPKTTSQPTPQPTAQPTPSIPKPTPLPPTPAGAGEVFTINTNLTQPSGITALQLQGFFKGTPLAADVKDFLQAEQQYHVSAIYLGADAALETGFGTSSIYLLKHNLFGFGAFDNSPFQSALTFPNDAACIAYVAWYVSVNYLTPPGNLALAYGASAGAKPSVPTGQYYVEPTVAGMAQNYATDPLWAIKIATLGDEMQLEALGVSS